MVEHVRCASDCPRRRRSETVSESSIDFSPEGRANRIDTVLGDLHVLKQEAAGLKDPRERELLHRRINVLIVKVQTERSHINFPSR